MSDIERSGLLEGARIPPGSVEGPALDAGIFPFEWFEIDLENAALRMVSGYNFSVSASFFVDTDTLVVDASNHKVGVGTDSPDVELHVVDSTGQVTIRAESGVDDNAAISLYSDSTQKAIIGYYAPEDSVKISHAEAGVTLATTHLVVKEGKIGIGTASPTGTLDVEGTFVVRRKACTSSTDALDVSGASSINIDSNGGDITIGGLSGGVSGQVVYLFKNSIANNVIIEHSEATGTQKIITADTADITLSNYGGVTLVCTGNYWFEVGH
jgi:hypothetical protein